jgi:hypothetical protein
MDANPPAIRDAKGRLLPEAKIGLGNSGQRHRAEIRRTLIDAETPEEVRRVGQWLLELAHSPRVGVRTRLRAMTVWLEYVIGRPPKAADVAGPYDRDDPEINVDDIMATVVEVLNRVPNGAEIKLALAEALERLAEARGLREPALLESH